MKKIYCVIILFLVSTETYASDKNLSFGMGAGALYSGIGLNVGVRSEKDFRFIAAGCVELSYTSVSGWQAACGVGAGWIWTNILSRTSNKHGMGIYLGSIASDGKSLDPKTIYGAGISYNYFLKGIDKSGWNLGVTPAIGRYRGDNRGYLLLQAGYQF